MLNPICALLRISGLMLVFGTSRLFLILKSRCQLSCHLIVLLTLQIGACSGSGPANDSTNQLSPFRALIVEIDGQPYRTFTRLQESYSIVEPVIIVADTQISLSLIVADDNQEVVCTAAGMPMRRESAEHFTMAIQIAYFEETIALECVIDDTKQYFGKITISASDPSLSTFLDLYLQRQILVGNSDSPNDPYSGYRRRSYYSEINRFISMAELYTNPAAYGIDSKSETYEKIELHLINTAEAFFEPCPNYDLYTGDSRQCRSEERSGPYYLWRSPNDKPDNVRVTHAKVEWRAAGGISQAIKALLLKNPGIANQQCPSRDNPSEMMGSNLTCRALNVRRLLYNEIWLKWNDVDWVKSVGLSSAFTISNTVVPHYIAWTEYMVDLFEHTAQIADTRTEIVAKSRKDYLLGYFSTFGDDEQYLNFGCSHEEQSRSCIWEGYDFSVVDSADISHSNTTIHLLSMYGNQEICDSVTAKCVSLSVLAKTLNERTWADYILNDGFAIGFPKFDVFINGHCQVAYENHEEPLQDFCNAFWLSEAEGWLPHRRLIGFVNLGQFNRELMIKLRASADNNQDGMLDMVYDQQLVTYVVFLYRALKSGGPVTDSDKSLNEG